MQASCDQVVTDVFTHVIEQTAFMFGEPAPRDTLAIIGAGFVQAAMSFRGPMQGTLLLAVPRSACLEITGNVLGMEVDDPFVAERATDSLKEILNVTCGHILTELAGEAPVFDLSIPEVKDLDDTAAQLFLDDPHTLAFQADDCPMLVQLIIDEG